MSAAIISITGLTNLTNLERLEIDNHAIDGTLDVSGLSNLTFLDASDCDNLGSSGIKTLNVTGCSSLGELRMDDNDFSSGFPSLNGLNNLKWIDFDQCHVTGSIDLSSLTSLEGFDFNNTGELTEVIISSAQPLCNNGREILLYDCALTQESVDNILVALSQNGISGGYVDLSNGTNSAPSSTGLAAKSALEGDGWSVYVNAAPPGRVGIAPSTDFDIVGDFTIEMFVNLTNTNGNPRPYSFGVYPAANAISFESGTAYFWGNNGILVSGAFDPTLGQWYHICVQRSGTDLHFYIDGISIASETYADDIPSQTLPLTIGYGNEDNSGFNGLMSNFRWTSSAIYNTAGFSVPTSPLTDLAGTKLLIFQGTNLSAQITDNSGNNHNATNSGATYSAGNPFTGIQGSLQMGNV